MIFPHTSKALTTAIKENLNNEGLDGILIEENLNNGSFPDIVILDSLNNSRLL